VNIVLLNQFYPPAQAPTGLLLGDLAEELVRRGHALTVIASAADYGAEGGPPARTEGGVRVIRVGPAGQRRSGIAAKFGDYLSFYRGAWRECSRLPERPDALVCMTTPPFIGLLGAHLRKIRGIPFVLWCMDLYPEALLADGFLREWNPLIPILRKLARIERGRAGAVIALGADMAARLAASGAGRVVEIPVWTSLSSALAVQAEARALRRARGWGDDEIVLLYSGNMGRAHRAEEFAALAECLRGSAPRCRFVFAGVGPLRAEWERCWGALFEFMPPAPAQACAAHLLSADVHLVSQQSEWEGVVVPSKFQAACALGKPVVFAGPTRSAVSGWLKEADTGWVMPPGDAAAVAFAARGILDAQLRAEQGKRALELYERQFTPAANCGRLADLIEQVAREQT
jgi:colanic acid biosynthesis glycosyl transferase WcaI